MTALLLRHGLLDGTPMPSRCTWRKRLLVDYRERHTETARLIASVEAVEKPLAGLAQDDYLAHDARIAMIGDRPRCRASRGRLQSALFTGRSFPPAASWYFRIRSAPSARARD